jgi:hypothetical protein
VVQIARATMSSRLTIIARFAPPAPIDWLAIDASWSARTAATTSVVPTTTRKQPRPGRMLWLRISRIGTTAYFSQIETALCMFRK